MPQIITEAQCVAGILCVINYYSNTWKCILFLNDYTY